MLLYTGLITLFIFSRCNVGKLTQIIEMNNITEMKLLELKAIIATSGRGPLRFIFNDTKFTAQNFIAEIYFNLFNKSYHGNCFFLNDL